MGSGIRSEVSLQANPTIIPWSPAPMRSMSSRSLLATPRCLSSRERLTPELMSLDCSWIETTTPQLL